MEMLGRIFNLSMKCIKFRNGRNLEIDVFKIDINYIERCIITNILNTLMLSKLHTTDLLMTVSRM